MEEEKDIIEYISYTGDEDDNDTIDVISTIHINGEYTGGGYENPEEELEYLDDFIFGDDFINDGFPCL